MKLLQTITAILISASMCLTGCAVFQSHEAAQTVYAGATASLLRWSVPAKDQHAVAQYIQTIGSYYNLLAGPTGAPTPDQVVSILKAKLPEGPDKDLAIGTFMTFYYWYYPIIEKYDVSKELAYFQDMLIGAARGSTYYL